MLNEILKLLNKVDNGKPNFPPTILYNEGWILRLVLNEFSKGIFKHKLSFQGNSLLWYSEALLPSFFRARFRGDSLSESWTHADGVIGDFVIGDKEKGDLSLKSDCKYFVVTEAKIFSKLSSGTKNSKTYNQAARNIGCIAKLIYDKKLDYNDFDKLCFYILLPQEQIINEPTFNQFIDKNNIIEVINQRFNLYRNDDYVDKDEYSWWYNNFNSFMEKIDIELISWESILEVIGNTPLKDFYSNCLRYNKKTA